MGRVALISDVHVDNYKAHGGTSAGGVNDRARLVLATLRAACDRAKALGAETLIVAGDLFNDVRPTPQLIAAVQDVLYGTNLIIYLLVGNHERVSTGSGDHALGPLATDLERGCVRIVEKPGFLPSALDEGRVSVLAVPFLPGKAVDTLREALALDGGPRKAAKGDGLPLRRLLVLHYGIAGHNTAPFLRDGEDALPLDMLLEVAKKRGFNAVFAGHWHKHAVWTRDDALVMQIGALAPRGWNDPGMDGYGTLVVYDTEGDSVEIEEIPGPRFLAVNGTEKIARGAATRLFIRRTYQEGEQPDIGTLPDWVTAELLPDLTDAIVATRAAAVSARASSSLDEALAAYVAAMSLPEGLERGKVLAQARAFLEGRE